jgi:hypothetical protein
MVRAESISADLLYATLSRNSFLPGEGGQMDALRILQAGRSWGSLLTREDNAKSWN